MNGSMMAWALAVVVATGVLSAALTWLVAGWIYRNRLQAALDQRLLEVQAEFEARVRAGVLAAGQELLPQLREQVKLGFQDAIRQSQTGELVESYAGVVNLGADALSQRLGGLFGFKPRK